MPVGSEFAIVPGELRADEVIETTNACYSRPRRDTICSTRWRDRPNSSPMDR
jgi:hypothetical protein